MKISRQQVVSISEHELLFSKIKIKPSKKTNNKI